MIKIFFVKYLLLASFDKNIYFSCLTQIIINPRSFTWSTNGSIKEEYTCSCVESLSNILSNRKDLVRATTTKSLVVSITETSGWVLSNSCCRIGRTRTATFIWESLFLGFKGKGVAAPWNRREWSGCELSRCELGDNPFLVFCLVPCSEFIFCWLITVESKDRALRIV